MKLKKYKGLKARDCEGNVVEILKVVKCKDWKKLLKYNKNGSMTKKDWKDFGLNKKDLIAAVETKEGYCLVYSVGNRGIDLVEDLNAIKQEKTNKEKIMNWSSSLTKSQLILSLSNSVDILIDSEEIRLNEKNEPYWIHSGELLIDKTNKKNKDGQ